MKERYHLTADLYELTRYLSGWRFVLSTKGFPVYYLKGEDWQEWEYKICSPEFSHQVAQGQAIQNADGPRAGRVFLAEKLQQIRYAMADSNVDNATAALHLRDLQKCLEIFLPFWSPSVLDL